MMFYLLTLSILRHYIIPLLVSKFYFLINKRGGKRKFTLSRINTIQKELQAYYQLLCTYIYKEQKQIIWIHQANCQKAMLNFIIHLWNIIE